MTFEQLADAINQVVSEKHRFSARAWKGSDARRVYINQPNGKAFGYIAVKRDGGIDYTNAGSSLVRREIKDAIGNVKVEEAKPAIVIDTFDDPMAQESDAPMYPDELAADSLA